MGLTVPKSSPRSRDKIVSMLVKAYPNQSDCHWLGPISLQNQTSSFSLPLACAFRVCPHSHYYAPARYRFGLVRHRRLLLNWSLVILLNKKCQITYRLNLAIVRTFYSALALSYDFHMTMVLQRSTLKTAFWWLSSFVACETTICVQVNSFFRFFG